MAARGPRRAPFGAPRSARPLLPAEGVYSAGRDGRRDLKEDLDEGTHKRDGRRCLREGLEKMSIKERWEGGKVGAECRDFGSQRTGPSWNILQINDLQKTTVR